jgi:mono/diheme cytochrome c family protein
MKSKTMHGGRGWIRGLRCGIAVAVVLILSGVHAIAAAVTLPDPAAMKAALPVAPGRIRVVEPHLSTRDHPTIVEYIGWPAERVLDQWLGSSWRAVGVEVEFRALDGYVSRIPGERFRRYSAFLVFERVGQASFSVDNRSQNEKNVPLGPYYLVWDNIRSPELVAEGGTYWPYQTTQLLVSQARLQSLLPGGMAARYADAAALAQKYCLSCHQVNGYGGDKRPGNLAAQVKALNEPTFLRWVLHPGEAKPGTTMPGLPDAMPDRERESSARLLFDYFTAVPVTP